VKRKTSIRQGLEESAGLLLETLARDGERIERLAKLFGSTLARGRTIFFCGNGGSAAEAQHFAAELVGRFVKERRAPLVGEAPDDARGVAVRRHRPVGLRLAPVDVRHRGRVDDGLEFDRPGGGTHLRLVGQIGHCPRHLEDVGAFPAQALADDGPQRAGSARHHHASTLH